MSDITVFRALADTYENIQKVRIRAENQLRAMQMGSDEYDDTRQRITSELAELRSSETRLRYEMTRRLRLFPVWREFLQHIGGIGSTIAGKLLALNLDPTKNLSAWNAYFGLTPIYYIAQCSNGHSRIYAKDPLTCLWRNNSGEVCGKGIMRKEKVASAPRRIRGYQGFWNPRARVLAYIIGMNFLKFGRFYREQYDRFKERLQSTSNGVKPIVIHLGAQRRTVQLFLAHYYQASNELEGRIPRVPYQFEYLNHSPSGFIHWREVVEYEKARAKEEESLSSENMSNSTKDLS